MNTYNHHVRTDIAKLLPAVAHRIVDVGCASGATLAWLKQRYPDAHTIGLEGNEAMRQELASNVDEAHIVDLNVKLPDIGTPDVVLCLDVLEHLYDPLLVLRQLVQVLDPDGSVIVSLPNVAHLSVSLPLIMQGRWSYEEEGILDRTHVRFYTQDSVVDLMTAAGLSVDRGVHSGLNGRKSQLADQLTFGRIRNRLAKQIIVRGRKGAVESPASWTLATQ